MVYASKNVVFSYNLIYLDWKVREGSQEVQASSSQEMVFIYFSIDYNKTFKKKAQIKETGKKQLTYRSEGGVNEI